MSRRLLLVTIFVQSPTLAGEVSGRLMYSGCLSGRRPLKTTIPSNAASLNSVNGFEWTRHKYSLCERALLEMFSRSWGQKSRSGGDGHENLVNLTAPQPNKWMNDITCLQWTYCREWRILDKYRSSAIAERLHCRVG